MAHEPKLEVFKISLSPKPKVNNTFATFLESNYAVDDVTFESDDAYLQFFADLLSTISEKYHLNTRKKKGLGLEPKEDGTVNDTIKLASKSRYIYGTLKGGRYGQDRTLGNIQLPTEALGHIDRNNIVFDNYYFLLYTPFESSKGILMIQSYTDDSINDIFHSWLCEMMKTNKFYMPTLTPYCPIRIQDEFKTNSVIKEMTFSHDIVLDNVENRETINTDTFTVEIRIKAKNEGVRMDLLAAFKNVFNPFGFRRPRESKVILLEDFKRKIGLLSDGTHQSSFQLDSDLDIRPTIYLRDRITLETDDSPNWESLHDFCTQLLEEIIPEVYPELKLVQQITNNEQTEN